MSEFTKGPWKWSDECLEGPDQEDILVVSGSPTDADAHLIAAAPELYEACKVVLAYLTVNCPFGGSLKEKKMEQLRAAIRKAEDITMAAT